MTESFFLALLRDTLAHRAGPDPRVAPGRWEHSAMRAKAPGPSGPGLAPWVRLAIHLLELKALVAVAVALGVAEVLTGGGPAALRGGLLRDGLGPPGAGGHALAEVLALHAQLLVAAGQPVPAGGPRALGPGGALGGSGQVSVLARPLGGESRENHCHIHCSGTTRCHLIRRCGFYKGLGVVKGTCLTKRTGGGLWTGASKDLSSPSQENRSGPREARWNHHP